jgi:hypothetical protein
MDNDNEKEVALEAAQNKLYKIRDREKKSYPEISAQQKHDIIASAVAQHRAALHKNSLRRRIDLRDASIVEAEIEEYLQNCEQYGQIPTMLGLAVSMGYSRNNLYAFLARHPETESANLLDAFRSASASIIAQASLGRTVDNATSIFLLKNSGQGLSDKTELEVTRGADPTERRLTAEEIAKKYEYLELPD